MPLTNFEILKHSAKIDIVITYYIDIVRFLNPNIHKDIDNLLTAYQLFADIGYLVSCYSHINIGTVLVYYNFILCKKSLKLDQ